MASSERDVKRAAELKLRLEARIAQLQDQIEMLNETLSYVDDTLRASTFTPAIEMMAEPREAPEVREMMRDKGVNVIATASVTPESVTIEPAGVSLNSATPRSSHSSWARFSRG